MLYVCASLSSGILPYRAILTADLGVISWCDCDLV